MKNMLKKLSVLLFCIVCVFAIVGCDTTGGNKNENTKYTSDTYPWPTTQTDSLKLTKDYAGKDFITDGIGEVSNVVRYVDGDTTVFKLANGKEVTIRYNGVNTPESTYRIEPWGYAASRYNKKLFADALAKGAKIVLEAEPNSDRVDTTGTRYLAWIWLVFPNGDSRLVNLELAELGYGLVKNASGTQYEKNFNDAMYDISKYKLNEIKPHVKLNFGKNSVFSISVTHSIPDAVCYVLYTKDGAIVYTGDFVMDATMTENYKTDIGKLAYVGKQGVLCLLSESIYAEKQGYTSPNNRVASFIREVLLKNENRIIATVTPAHFYRIQEL